MGTVEKHNNRQPYKRKLTEKRRIQNRAAQQTYRAKRKTRLEFLERTVATSRTSNENAEQVSAIAEAASSSQSVSNYGDLEFTIQETTPITTYPDVREDARGRANSSSTALIEASATSQSPPAAATPRSSAVKDSTIAALKEVLQLGDEEDIDDLMEFAIEMQPDLKAIVLAGLRSLRTKDNDSTVLHSSNPGPGAGRYMSQQSSSQFPDIGSIIPSPFVNGIALRPQVIYDVCYHNARTLGLSLPQIMKPDCPSPFENSLTTSSTLPLWNTVPPDLRPTPSQIHIPHHPFMDLIPFPWFRDRAIALASLDPPAYDRMELKVDMMNGGLVCWKSRARSTGQPWDRRSWEAEPWFLRKWGWLVEEQGRVEQQSRWWKALRGEGEEK